jgi:hypothetical protein
MFNKCVGHVNLQVYGLTCLTCIYFYFYFFAWLLGFCHFCLAIKIKITLNVFTGWNLLTSKLNVFTGCVVST